MIQLNVVLMVVAFVCLLLAAFGVPTNRVGIGWLGLAFWALAVLLQQKF